MNARGRGMRGGEVGRCEGGGRDEGIKRGGGIVMYRYRGVEGEGEREVREVRGEVRGVRYSYV